MSVQRASQAASEAIHAEEEGRVWDAIHYYRTALAEVHALMLQARNEYERCDLRCTSGAYLDRLSVLEERVASEEEPPLVLPSVPNNKTSHGAGGYEHTNEAISTGQKVLVATDGGQQQQQQQQSTESPRHKPFTPGPERMCDVVGMDAVEGGSADGHHPAHADSTGLHGAVVWRRAPS